MTSFQNHAARYYAHGVQNAAAPLSRYVVDCFLKPAKSANSSSRSLDSMLVHSSNQRQIVPTTKPIEMYDMVSLHADTAYGNVIYRKGTAGAIVHIYEGKGAYEVEFSDPEPGVLTLRSFDIVPL